MKKLCGNKTIQHIMIAVIAVVFALLAELSYLKISEPYPVEYYPKTELSDADFEPWEFRDEGGGRYFALAYNSYFKSENLKGIPAKTLTVHLSRDAADATETVVYFDGEVDGARGEFVAVLSKIADGRYFASIPCDALYGIRIYPTESVRSTIVFDGAAVNETVPIAQFSGARLILWVFIALNIYILYILLASFVFKKREKPRPWPTVYIIVQGLSLIVVMQAARLFSSVRGMESVLLPATLAFVSALFGLAWMVAVKLKTAPAKLAICVLALGIAMSVANAPMQTPDEYWHYLRAYSISQGRFAFDVSYDYPDDVQLLIDRFPGVFNKFVHDAGESTVRERFAEYFQKAGEPYVGERVSTPVQLIVPYVPAAVGMAAARVFGLRALGCLFAGRIVNVAVLAFCAYYALSRARRFRVGIIAAALLPLTLYMGASLSYDSMFLSCTLLFFGVVFSDEVRRGDLALLLLSFGTMISIKPVYAPLALLIFAMPRDAFDKFKIKRTATFGICLFAGLVCYLGALEYAELFARGIAAVGNPSGSNTLVQIGYVLQNPARYAVTAAVDGWTNTFYLTQFGEFGWLDAHAQLTCLLTPIAVVAVAALCSGDALRERKRNLWLYALVVALEYAIIVTGFYCTWSTPGSTSILGVQARYFIPLLPCVFALLCFLFAALFGKQHDCAEDVSRRDRVCIYLFATIGIISIAELVVIYYLT
ncbi:MAG: DUF2142 domain-containing protein [Oscillospiraceae bacterium]